MSKPPIFPIGPVGVIGVGDIVISATITASHTETRLTVASDTAITDDTLLQVFNCSKLHKIRKIRQGCSVRWQKHALPPAPLWKTLSSCVKKHKNNPTPRPLMYIAYIPNMGYPRTRQYYGPFQTRDDAVTWCHTAYPSRTWQICMLTAPTLPCPAILPAQLPSQENVK